MDKKKLLSVIVCIAAVVIIVVVLLCANGCDNKQGATADEAVIETRIETVTEIATDQQGSTFIEEATKVVEVKTTEKATEPTENETSDNNSSKTDTSSNKTSSSSAKSESSNNNSSTNKNTYSNNSSSSTTNKNNSSSTTNKNNSSSSGSSSSSTTSKPSSSGSSTSTKTWHEAEYEYINHPVVTEKVWVVDKKAYTYEEPVYEEQGRYICKVCNEDITNNTTAHNKQHALNGEPVSYKTTSIEVQVGTKTVTVPEEGHWETRVVKDAWTEKKLVREAGYY